MYLNIPILRNVYFLKIPCLYVLSAQRKGEEEIGSDLSKIKMDWRQTSNTITLFYQTINDYQGIYYRISRINDAKLVFNLSFEKDIVIHELELAGEIEWPPAWNRNYESMEVSRFYILSPDNYVVIFYSLLIAGRLYLQEKG